MSCFFLEGLLYSFYANLGKVSHLLVSDMNSIYRDFISLKSFLLSCLSNWTMEIHGKIKNIMSYQTMFVYMKSRP